MSLAWTHYPDSELTHCSYSLMLRAMRKKNSNANVIVFGLIQSGLKTPMSYHTRVEHANRYIYNTDAVYNLFTRCTFFASFRDSGSHSFVSLGNSAKKIWTYQNGNQKS
jgi:hypothetical protein